MAIDPSTLEYQYRRVAGGENDNQKATYGVEFSSGGANYTFIPSSVINKGVAAGEKNYVFPWFLEQGNLEQLGKNAQFVDLKGQSWYGDYLKDTVGASTEGFLVPSGSVAFDSKIKPTTAAVQGLGNTSEGLSYILDKQGSDGKYIASDGRITTLTAGRSLLGKVFGGLGDDLAGAIMGGFETLGGLPPVVTAAISAYNPVLGAAITGAKIGGAVGSGQADLGDAAKAIAASYAGSQVGAAVGGGATGQIAGGTTSGLLQGQDLESSLTNAAINTGANAAAGGLMNTLNPPAPNPYGVGGVYGPDNSDVGGGFNPSGLNIPQGEGATLGSIGAQADTPSSNPNFVNTFGTSVLGNYLKSALTGSTGSQGTGNMATTQENNLLGSLLGGSLTGVGGLMQGSTSAEAAQAQANAIRAAGQQAAASSQFRPVGTTTTFGTSNFQVDPTTGQLTSAGYNLSPQLQQYQNTLMAGGQQSLTDAANLQNLGRGYIAQSPEAAAQQYMTAQQALLAPSRDTESARLANQLQQTGRTGVSVAQGGSLGMANPEQQALANARAMQDLQLAAQAQAQGRAQTQFGQGLLTSAYDPFSAGLKTAGSVEALGQQPFTMSTDLAKLSSAAGANSGRLGLAADMSAADAALKAGQYNPYATAAAGLGGSSLFGKALGNVAGNTSVGSALAKYLGGLGGYDYNALNTAASNFINSNPDIIPQSTFSGGGADMLDPELRALLGL
jgi:hypothetical protein